MAVEQDTPLASLSLTHVYYDPSDPISLLCAYLALVPQALCVVYATLVLTSREAEVVLSLAGQLACEVLNLVLKRSIKQRRPSHHALFRDKGYGMPSSHAQFLAYWAASLALFLLFRYRPSSSTASSSSSFNWPLRDRLALCLSALFLAAAVSWSRVYLAYHSPAQVLVGSAAGSAFALAWFLFTGAVRRRGWLAWALDLPPARALRARDLVLHEDLCQAGWEKWLLHRHAAALQQKQKSP